MLPQLSRNLTKTQIKSIAESSVMELVDNGRILEAVELLSVMEHFIKEVKANDNYIDCVLTEVQKYGKSKETETMKIELCEVGTKYNFDLCGDPVIKDLQWKLDTLEAEIKERKEFLKTVPASGMDLVVGDEIVTIYPPVKLSTSSYKTTIKK
jgi:NifU-like protein involved in Fe-S cluster formation